VLVYASELSFVAPHDDRSDDSDTSDGSIVSLVTDSVAYKSRVPLPSLLLHSSACSLLCML
jgi:hypothetical protein